MTRFVLHRLAAVVPVLLLVSLAAFSFIYLVPGDPAVTLAGEGATFEQIELIRSSLGLDRPLAAQYVDWVTGAITGDLGDSLFSAQTVNEALGRRIPVTLSLVLAGFGFAVIMAVPAGLLAATHRGRKADRVVSAAAVAGVALPSYVVGMFLVLAFALGFGWFPATGYIRFGESPSEWLRHIVLPGLALGLPLAAVITRQLRSSLSDVLRQDYIRTAEAKGLPARVVLLKHALKNAAMPVLTAAAVQVGTLVSGTVIIEKIFGIQGMGSLAIEAVLRRDIPMIQGIVLVAALFVQGINLATDVLYGWLNPKVRPQ